jgi:PleD family two-component response regulator
VSAWQPGEAIDACIKRCDEALYSAKHAGRDRVVAA